MTKAVRILLAIAVTLISIATIFFFSEQPGSVSHTSSMKVAEWTAERIIKMSPSANYSAGNATVLAKALDYPIRKLAHLFIYFMLGLIVYLGLRFVLADKMRPAFAFLVILLVFLTACADEINQYFNVARGASFGDVILDTVGGTLGMYFFHIIQDFIMHIKSLFRKNTKKA
jgi:VanZ family protein